MQPSLVLTAPPQNPSLSNWRCSNCVEHDHHARLVLITLCQWENYTYMMRPAHQSIRAVATQDTVHKAARHLLPGSQHTATQHSSLCDSDSLCGAHEQQQQQQQKILSCATQRTQRHYDVVSSLMHATLLLLAAIDGSTSGGSAAIFQCNSPSDKLAPQQTQPTQQ